MVGSTSSDGFDETKHPRGQPDNAGKFRRRLLPRPPLAKRRRRGHDGSSTSLEEMARDAGAIGKCPLCHGNVIIVTPRPGDDPVEWCRCGDSLRNEVGLPLMEEIEKEIVRQGRLPHPYCRHCGVKLECRDPSVHVHGLHGSECHAFRHVVEECERRPVAASSRSSQRGDATTYEGAAPADSATAASRERGELQEEGAAEAGPPARERRRAKNAVTVTASAVVLAGSTVPGWSSVLEVRLAMLVATAALLVQAPHILREMRRNWRKGTELKHQVQRMRAENELRAELNGHLSRLVADATAANDAIKAFDDGIEQSGQQDPVRNEMADTARRALVAEARARNKTASEATGRAQAVGVLPSPERIDAITELIKELGAT